MKNCHIYLLYRFYKSKKRGSTKKVFKKIKYFKLVYLIIIRFFIIINFILLKVLKSNFF